VCRDCFNIRVNFPLEKLEKTWNRKVFLSFTDKTTVVKVAGPATTIEFDGRDFNGNYRYVVSFQEGHEFGDNRVDINAGKFEMILTKMAK